MNAYADENGVLDVPATLRDAKKERERRANPWWRRLRWDMLLFWPTAVFLSGLVTFLVVRSWVG